MFALSSSYSHEVDMKLLLHGESSDCRISRSRGDDLTMASIYYRRKGSNIVIYALLLSIGTVLLKIDNTVQRCS